MNAQNVSRVIAIPSVGTMSCNKGTHGIVRYVVHAEIGENGTVQAVTGVRMGSRCPAKGVVRVPCMALWLAERSPSYAYVMHPCSPDTLGRYPSTFPRTSLAQRVVSPLWRYDHHDGFYRRSPREEFGPLWGMCNLSREGRTRAGRRVV